jgi:hypothetical protein
MTSILKVDTIQDTAGNNIINESSDTITIGASGDTVNIVGTLQNNGSAFAQGITEADAWRLNTSATFSSLGVTDVTANWERVDTDGFDKIGTGLSESSGIFSFPSTGYYYINHFGQFLTPASRLYLGFYLSVTLDNSTYSSANEIYTNAHTSSAYANVAGSFIIKVTDTTNIKFKFQFERNDTADLFGGTSNSKTGFNCIKLGEI